MAIEVSKSDKPTWFDDDDDDDDDNGPLPSKLQTASKKNQWHSAIKKSNSLGHAGQSHRQNSDVPSSNGQSSSIIQQGNNAPSTKASPMSASLVNNEPKPLLQQKMSFDVKEGPESIKHHTKDNCEGSVDDIALGARSKMNSDHDDNAVVVLSSGDSDDDDDYMPLGARSKKPISKVQKEQQNGSGANNKQEKPSTLLVKRPLEKSNLLHSCVKKAKVSVSDPAASINTKLVLGESDDDVPISQRIKKLAIKRKLTEVTKGNKCGSPSYKRHAKKSKRSRKGFEYSIPSSELDLKEKELALVQKSIEECQMKRQAEQQRLHTLERDIEECSKELENKKKQVDSIQGQLSSMKKQFEGRVMELESKEKHFEGRVKDLKSKENQLEGRVNELESIEEHLESWEKELKSKEKQFEGQVKDLESKEKQLEEQVNELESIEDHLEGWDKELESKEKLFEGRVKDLESKEKQFEELVKEINSKEKQFEGRAKDLELKEKQFEGQVKEINSKEKQFEGRVKDFESKENKFEERVKVLKSKERQFEGRVKELESKERQFEGQVKELKSKNDKFEVQEKELNSKKKQFERQVKEIECKEKQYEVKVKELKSKEKQFEEQVKDLESKRNQFEGQLKELELKENQYEALVKSFEEQEVPDKQLSPTTDGRSWQLLSNAQTKETELLANNDVLVNLKTSSDPAKLVLDIIQNPIVPQCRKEGNAVIVDRYQIFLLEQLMILSPHIKLHVRDEAMKLALDLKANINSSTENSVVVLGFLLLLSIYGLVSYFNEDEVLKLFEFVAQHKQAVELFRTLGFVDKVSDFVRSLIEKKQHIEAVGFICTYKLVEKYQPVDLLREYVQNARLIYESSCKGVKSIEIKVKAIDQEIASLETVLQCISDNNIESQDLHKGIQVRILELERQKANGSICTGIRLCS